MRSVRGISLSYGEIIDFASPSYSLFYPIGIESGYHRAVITVESLHYYPIKGCRGISSEKLSFDECGFVDDRRWMIVDSEGRFISQRSAVILATIETKCFDDGIELSAPKCGTIEVERPTSRDRKRKVSIWNDEVEALSVTTEAVTRWLSRLLNRPAELVYLGHQLARPIHDKYGPGYVSFADTLPFLLTNTASLADLNSRLKTPASMDRFRPNIVIRFDQPFAEHDWSSLRIGSHPFMAVKSCVRCQVPTIDQRSGEKAGKEPIATLSGYRKEHGKIVFGQLLKPLDKGTMHCGETLTS